MDCPLCVWWCLILKNRFTSQRCAPIIALLFLDTGCDWWQWCEFNPDYELCNMLFT